MPIKMSCPGCKAVFQLPDAARGKKCRCQKCGGIIDATRVGSSPGAGPARSAAAPVAAFGPSKPPSRLRPVLALVGLLLFCGVLGAFTWNQFRGQTAATVAELRDTGPTRAAAKTSAPARPRPTARTTAPAPVPEPPEEPPPAPGTPAARILGKWAHDNHFRLEFRRGGKCEQASPAGEMEALDYKFADEATLVLASPRPGQIPQKHRIDFHSDDEISIFNAPGGKEVRYFRLRPALFGGVEEKYVFRLPTSDHDAVAISKDRRYLVAANGPVIRVFDLEDGKQWPALEGHQDRISALAFLPDGKLISTSHDQTIRLWDVAGAKLLDTFAQSVGPLNTAAFSADGKYVATVGSKVEVNLFDLKAQKDVATLPMPNNVAVTALAFTPDSNGLIGIGSHYARMWDVPGGGEANGFGVRGFQGNASLAFSADGRRLAIGTTGVVLWDATAHRVLTAYDTYRGPPRALAFSPDGSRLAVASGKWVQLWNVADGKAGPPLIGHARDVQSLAWSADGRYLATGGWDSTVRVWAIPGGFR